MDRADYNACMSQGMSGKELSKEERRREFCVVAKMCSGKAKDRDSASNLCSRGREDANGRSERANKRHSKVCLDKDTKILIQNIIKSQGLEDQDFILSALERIPGCK